MSKNKARRPKRGSEPARNGRDRQPLPSEDRRSLAVTVAWMMATLATAVALLATVGAYGLVRILPSPPAGPNPLAALPGVLWFTSAISGLLTWALIPAVYRVRPTAPPRAVTAVSAAIASGPWVVLLVTVWI